MHLNNIIGNTYKNFKHNFKSMVFFEILYKLLAVFIFIPINYGILNWFMKDMGVQNITNKDLIKLGLTSQGIVYIILIVIISFMAVFVEIGILTYMAYKSHHKERVSLLEGTINTFTIFPKTPSLYMVGLIFISGIVGPLTGIGLYNSLITKLTIPSFIKMELFKTMGGKVLFVAIMSVMIILLLRWLLSIPIMVIEQVSFKEAFKNSIKLYKNNKWRIILYIVAWTVVNYILRFVILGSVVGLTTLSMLRFQKNYVIAPMVMSGGLIVFFILYMIISIITLPLFISFLVELYYKYRFYGVEERVFVPMDYYEDRKFYRWILRHRKKIVIVISLIFVIVSGSMGISSILNNIIGKDVDITAHRGSSSKAPENSVSAIRKAIEEKADYAEIDVMTTKDDKVVVFHDNTLKRISGINNSIKYMTLEEVKEVDIGSHYSKEFSEEKIPTLDEVLRICKNKIKLNIELKVMKKDDDLPERVVESIKRFNMVDQVVISSQDYEGLQKVKELEPMIDVGFILTFGVGDFTKLDVDFISVEYDMLKKELVYGMHALNKKVHVWTVNDRKKAENAIKLGADNIITDSVDMVEDVSQSLKSEKSVDYLTIFYDSIHSLIKYVRI